MPDWVSIVREHGPMTYQTAWRILGNVHDTEDAVQDALLEALRAYRSREVHNWGGLLRQAVTRRALDRLRKRRNVTVVSATACSSKDEQPDAIAEAKELSAWLREILAQLPQRQAEVFSLRYFGEMTNPDIAATLHISVEAVAVALHKARNSIAKKLIEVKRAVRIPQK